MILNQLRPIPIFTFGLTKAHFNVTVRLLLSLPSGHFPNPYKLVVNIFRPNIFLDIKLHVNYNNSKVYTSEDSMGVKSGYVTPCVLWATVSPYSLSSLLYARIITRQKATPAFPLSVLSPLSNTHQQYVTISVKHQSPLFRSMS